MGRYSETRSASDSIWRFEGLNLRIQSSVEVKQPKRQQETASAGGVGDQPFSRSFAMLEDC